MSLPFGKTGFILSSFSISSVAGWGVGLFVVPKFLVVEDLFVDWVLDGPAVEDWVVGDSVIGDWFVGVLVVGVWIGDRVVGDFVVGSLVAEDNVGGPAEKGKFKFTPIL